MINCLIDYQKSCTIPKYIQSRGSSANVLYTDTPMSTPPHQAEQIYFQ